MENQIFITFFLNPHKFWYKPFHPGSKKTQLKQMQDAIDEYCEQHYMKQEIVDYEPIFGEVVAYFDPSLARWARCSVDGVKEDDKRMRTYRLWLIDEGYPKDVDMEHLKPLPEKFQDKSTSNVKQGAIKNILPAHCVYDPIGEELRKTVCFSWNISANNMLQSLIEGTQRICFANVSSYPFGKESKEFGDLLFYTNNKTFNAVDVLSQWAMGLIVDSETFLSHMFERKSIFGSRASSLVSETLDDSSAKMLKQSINTNEVNERHFDESASMVGVTTKQPAVVLDKISNSVINSSLSATSLQSGDENGAQASVTDIKVSKLRRKIQQQMAHKMKNAPLKEMKHLQDDELVPDHLSRIRMGTQSLTIDVAQSTQAEYTLMHIKPSKISNLESETIRANPQDKPPLTKQANNETSAEGGSAPKFLRKIARIKANLNQQKHIVPVKEQSMPSAIGFSPAGVPICSLLASEKLPTSDSNASLQRFEKVIQDEKCLFSRKSHYRVLVHGSKLPHPIDRIEAANFSPRVHQNLVQLGITKIHRLQAYSWPHILRDNSFICINGASTGKTFAYLPAVCSVVQRQVEEILIPHVAGPVAIIICYSSREAQRIAFFCRTMLNSASHPELTVLECYGIRNVTKNCNLLFNGCAILVTTAPGYRRLYERAPEAFNRKRIQTVVIDNIEKIWPHFAPDLRMLCKNCDKEGLQMIVTAGYWIPVLAIFLQRYHNMIICIGAFIEAAVYAKADFSFRLFANDEQNEIELIRQLRQHNYRNERTIVFGKDSKDLLPIVNALKQNSINHIVCNERLVLQQHAGFRNWDEQLPGDMAVFVCSDEVLADLKITKAQHIIHYSLPSTWSTFTRRYVCSIEFYKSPYFPCESKQANGKPSSLVLLNENNSQELPKLVDFLELHLPKVSEQLLEHVKRIRSFHESDKIADGRAVSMLCTHVLGLSVCRSIRNCVYRHALTTDDMATEIVPTNGKIRMKICHVFSPAHYAVHLEAHQPASTNNLTTLNDSRRYLVQDIAVQVHYANEDRHRMHGEPRRNDLCAVYHDQNYSRCRIINHEETSVDNCEVQLQLIDTGRIVHMKSSALLFLPEQFRELPGQALNVRIAALVPHDYEQDWDKTATLTVRQWIEDHANRPNCYMEGNVLLAIKDTIWIDDLCLIEQLKGVNATVTTKRIGATVISKQFGIGDKKSFEQIRQIVHDCEKIAMQLLRNKVQEHESQNNLDEPDNVDELEMKNEDKTNFVNCQQSDQLLEMTHTDDRFYHPRFNSVPCDHGELENGANIMKASVEYQQTVETDQEGLVLAKLDFISSSSSSFEELSLSRDLEQYQFDTFLVHNSYNVIIGHYLAPDNFYVYRCDRISQVDDAIKEFVKDGSNLTPLMNPHVHQHCLVLYENCYHRARIMKLLEVDNCIEAEVFLLDFGGTFKCRHMFKISNKLLRSVSFLAVKGSLAHIHPPNGATEWTEEVANAIYDKWLEKHNQGTMFAIVTRVLPWGCGERIEGCHRYELVLGDGNSSDEFSIISDIVYDKLAILLQEDIEDEAGSSTVADTDDDFMQVNFTQQELINMMKEIAAPRSKDSKKRPIEASHHISEVPVSEISSSALCMPSDKLLAKSDEDKKIKLLRSDRKLHQKPLVSDYRFAQTVWQQDQYFIVLRVHAPDVKRYDLVANHNSLLLQFVKTDDDQRYVVPLNLFSAIDPRYTAHEIRGLSIVVRLRKLVPSTRWPKLHKYGRKFAWLKAATTTVDDSGSSSDEVIKKKRWKDLVQAKLDSSVDSSQSGNEQDIDSDVEDEEGMFLAMS